MGVLVVLVVLIFFTHVVDWGRCPSELSGIC